MVQAPGEKSACPEIAIVGAGIGGLVLALELHRVGLRCTVYEAAEDISPLGVGINLLPHSTRVLHDLGLEEDLAAVAVTTKDSVYYNRFGQFIYSEPAGRYAGHAFPQFSIYRPDLQAILLKAVRERLGKSAVLTNHRCMSFAQHENRVTLQFTRSSDSGTLDPVVADIVIACDGVHSAVRKQLYPNEGEPRYSGITMWRGVTVGKPFLSGATMARVGWFANGKIVIYPIKKNVDNSGHDLINWVAEIETPQRGGRDWTRQGSLDDFLYAYMDREFDWLNIPKLIRDAGEILEYPMVDQEPLPRWTFGRVTLLGDAAHPMVPRGSNGAGQAILDANKLAALLGGNADPLQALVHYESERLSRTAAIVRANRSFPPDTIIREVWDRSGDKPFERIEDVITTEELAAISHRYQDVAGFSLDAVQESQ